jgi:hypothetical protein
MDTEVDSPIEMDGLPGIEKTSAKSTPTEEMTTRKTAVIDH